MKRLIPALAAAALAAGCGGKEGGTCPAGTVSLSDANNFQYAGDLILPTYETASGSDIAICWDALTEDLQCHEMDPAGDIDNVGLVRFPFLSHEDIQADLSNNSLQQADVSGYVEYNTEGGQTCANLVDFSFFGTPIDVTAEYTEEGGSYLLLLATGTTIGVGTRMLAFLEPSAGSTNTQVDISGGCDVLDFEATISDQAVDICDSSLEVDWSGLTRDGLGNELLLSDINSLSVGFYEGASVADLEGSFLDLELIATTWWSMDLEAGTGADLSQATTAEGEPFSGFDGDGVYLLALRCTTCYNPAPLFLTVLNPVEEG